MPLNEQQIAAMRTADNNALAAQNPAIYYEALSQHYVFGTLGLGVVRDDTISGIPGASLQSRRLWGSRAIPARAITPPPRPPLPAW